MGGHGGFGLGALIVSIHWTSNIFCKPRTTTVPPYATVPLVVGFVPTAHGYDWLEPTSDILKADDYLFGPFSGPPKIG